VPIVAQSVAVSTWVGLFNESGVWDISEQELETWDPGMPKKLHDSFTSWYVRVPMLSVH